MMLPVRGDRIRNRRVTRRGLMFLGLQLGVVGTLGWRMRQLQVEQSEQFRLLAEENRINYRLIAPERGLVFDRNGVALAKNQKNYRVVMVREQADDAEMVLARLASLLGITKEARDAVWKEMRKRSAFLPVTVKQHLSWEEFTRVAANAPALPGVNTEVGLNRLYPLSQDFAHILGYVGPVSESDLAAMPDPDPLFQIPRFPIGKTGVERTLEDNLRGKAGLSKIEVNATGRVMRELGRDPATNGQDIQLTVDTKLQEYALKRLEGESAAAVVIDVRNGNLLAMASTPSFNPNSFVTGISTTEWTGLRDNEFRPLADKTVSGAYPPGSVFKMMVALAALKEGVIDPKEKIYCPGHYDLGGRRFYCWKRGGHGQVDLNYSLKQSCDVFYYETAKRVGIEKIAEMAKAMGLGRKFDIPLSAMTSGLIPNQAYKLRVFGQGWLQGDTLNSGIGQGFVLTSPIQLAVMTARLATGKDVLPNLLYSVDGVPVKHEVPADIGLGAEDLARVQAGMNAVVNDSRGTAYKARIADKSNKMAGKTGTAQVRGISTAERESGVLKGEDLPWKYRDHALFVCFAPFDNPQYAVAIVVEHGGSGSGTAAPIARDVMMHALYDGEPPLTAYPAAERNRIRAEREKAQAAAANGDT